MPSVFSNPSQITVPPDVLDAVEANFAPSDDPVFQLVPPTFEFYVTSCFTEMGKPAVTFDTFWEVYNELRDLVEVAVPIGIVETLAEGVQKSDVSEQFSFAHMKDPVIEGIQIEGEEGGAFFVDFSDEENDDELC